MSAGPVPWNKGTHAFDRGWQEGYRRGVEERFWPKLRHLWPLGVLLALVVLARSRRTSPIVRLFVIELLLAGAALTVALLPLEVPVAVVAFVRHRRRLAALRAPIAEEPL